MNPNIFSTALGRTPLLSYQDTIADVWEELKKAIQVSSPDLYVLIKDVDYADYNRLPHKIKFSCWKYFNRARYRATPFGAFGSISQLNITNNEQPPIVLTQQAQPHHFVDWSHKDIFISDIDLCYQQASLLWSNTSIYPCGEQLRYINLNTQGIFEISSIDNQQIIDAILTQCQTPCDKQGLVDYLQQRHELKPFVIEDLLKQLIQLQLLLTDCHPNIIGTDYFKRLHLQPNEAISKTDTYIISTRQVVSGNLSTHTFKVIPEAIRVLRAFLPKNQQPLLEKFKRDFQQKYEYKEVPILTALDPELGVGYGDFATSPINDTLVEAIKNNHTATEDDVKQLPYTAFHQQLLNQVIKQQDIDLATFIDKKATHEETALLPNTMSAIVQVADEQIILEHLGGCTANALLGRFTLADQELRKICKDLVTIEEQSNPDVIFFDIGYQAEQKIDNINRRSAIFTHELSILTWPGSKEVISLQDIWVSVKQNEVVLRSKKHNKRLIPRLATAYNYTRSDLAIYRFLCDIQRQNLHTSLSIQLKNYFPGLDYYPRISYKNIVISARSWKVPDNICSGAESDRSTQLAYWLKSNQIPKYFKCNQNDQFLWFNSRNQEDLHFFLTHIKGNKGLYITEAFMPTHSLIKNEAGNSYLSQYILSIYHRNQIYKPLSPIEMLSYNHPAIFIPGDEWVHFEIYTPPTQSEFLLSHIILPYIKAFRKYFKKWFFIRYPIPKPHIRLRLQLKNVSSLTMIVTSLSARLRQGIMQGIINDLQIKPYVREMERYGKANIDLVEKCFWLDSQYTLQLIHQNTDIQIRYLMTIRLLRDLLSIKNITADVHFYFIKDMAKRLAIEHGINGKTFKKINETYKELQNARSVSLSKRLERSYQKTLLHMQSLVASQQHLTGMKLIGDFMHMHINRLFNTDQRIHELIIYQYYQKQLLEQQKHQAQIT